MEHILESETVTSALEHFSTRFSKRVDNLIKACEDVKEGCFRTNNYILNTLNPTNYSLSRVGGRMFRMAETTPPLCKDPQNRSPKEDGNQFLQQQFSLQGHPEVHLKRQ